MKKIISLTILLFSSLFAKSEKLCDYNNEVYIDYLHHTYQYVPGDIDESCIKVYTKTTHLIKEDNVEIPTSSSWKITKEGECRCVDNTSPESMWNRTFPRDARILTTKEIHFNLKKIKEKMNKFTVVAKEGSEKIEIKKPIIVASNNKKSIKIEKPSEYKKPKNETLYLSKNYNVKKVKVTNDSKFINTKKKNKDNKYTVAELNKLKLSKNNTFITTKNYMVDLLLREPGTYEISLDISKDINILQVFDENLERIKEFRFYDSYLVKGKFQIKTDISQRITLVSLNPNGEGRLKGFQNIRVKKIK